MTPLQRYLAPELLRRLSTLTVSARTVAAGSTIGVHRAPVRGSSIEFRQHRFYTPGDEPRRIDWRVYARTDRPYVREYEQETNLRCLILLDASGSMAYGSGGESKLLYARRAAAALAYVMLSQTEAVGLATFGGTTQFLPPHGGQAQLSRVLDALDHTVGAGGGGSGGGGGGPGLLSAACVAAANRLTRRTLVIVISDLLIEPEPLSRGLARLRHDLHEVAVLRVSHRDELTFPFSRWCRFVGAEGEGVRVIEPAVARRDYLARFEQHRERLRTVFKPLSVRHHEAVTDSDLGDEISRFIISRGVPSPVRASGGGGRGAS